MISCLHYSPNKYHLKIFQCLNYRPFPLQVLPSGQDIIALSLVSVKEQKFHMLNFKTPEKETCCTTRLTQLDSRCHYATTATTSEATTVDEL